MDRFAEVLTEGELTLRRWRADEAVTFHRVMNRSLGHIRPWVLPVGATCTEQQAAEFVVGSRRGWAEGTAYDYAVCAGAGDAPSRAVAQRLGFRFVRRRVGRDGVYLIWRAFPANSAADEEMADRVME